MTILTSKPKVEINRCISICRRSCRNLLLLLLLRCGLSQNFLILNCVYFYRIGSLIFIAWKTNHVLLLHDYSKKVTWTPIPSRNKTRYVSSRPALTQYTLIDYLHPSFYLVNPLLLPSTRWTHMQILSYQNLGLTPTSELQFTKKHIILQKIYDTTSARTSGTSNTSERRTPTHATRRKRKKKGNHICL